MHQVSSQGNKELLAGLVFHTSYPRPQFSPFLQEPTPRDGQLCLRFCSSNVHSCMLELERVSSSSIFSVRFCAFLIKEMLILKS